MTRLERELATLKGQVLDMGALAETMVAAAAEAIARPERATIERVAALEPRLDAMQVAIDREAIRLMTVYAPVAKQLRFLVTIARITSELERMGDHAVDNCEYAELLLAHPAQPPLADLSDMSALAQRMVHEALQALRAEDPAQARETIRLDDAIDAQNGAIVRAVLQQTMSEHELATRCIEALVSRSIERIADHATNICEEVFYFVEGEDIRHRD